MFTHFLSYCGAVCVHTHTHKKYQETGIKPIKAL